MNLIVRAELAKLMIEHQQKKEAWRSKRKKAFINFIKQVLEKDKRFTITPYSESLSSMWSRSIITPPNILGEVMLQREGTYAPVTIEPFDNKYGIYIQAGSRMTRMTILSYPSNCLAWPSVIIADELERQFSREVEWEMNKHNQSTATTKWRKKKGL